MTTFIDGRGVTFGGSEKEPCIQCGANFEHSPELCTMRRMASSLEQIAAELNDISENVLPSIARNVRGGD